MEKHLFVVDFMVFRTRGHGIHVRTRGRSRECGQTPSAQPTEIDPNKRLHIRQTPAFVLGRTPENPNGRAEPNALKRPPTRNGQLTLGGECAPQILPLRYGLGPVFRPSPVSPASSTRASSRSFLFPGPEERCQSSRSVLFVEVAGPNGGTSPLRVRSRA